MSEDVDVGKKSRSDLERATSRELNELSRRRGEGTSRTSVDIVETTTGGSAAS